MKKMTKALALLTVMAMLATLFVAVPASASKAAMTGFSPKVDVVFTSDAAGTTVVDADALPAGSVFYAWVEAWDMPTDAYLQMFESVVAYDKTAVTPYNLKKNLAATSAATAKNAVLHNADFADQMYSADDATGTYQDKPLCDWTLGHIDNTIWPASDIQDALTNEEALDDYTEDTFWQIPAQGVKTKMFGVAFIKNTGDPTGVTIATAGKTLNGKTVTPSADQEIPACAVFIDQPDTFIEAQGANSVGYNFNGAGDGVVGVFTDLSPRDSEATEAPTDEPTEAPTDVPTEAPTDVPEAQGEVTGAKQVSKSAKLPNAFFYEFTTPVIPGEVTGLTATFQIDGKDAVAGDVTNINLTNISEVALKIAAIVKNIPEGQETTPVTTTYTLNYSVAGVPKTLVWSCTDSLN